MTHDEIISVISHGYNLRQNKKDHFWGFFFPFALFWKLMNRHLDIIKNYSAILGLRAKYELEKSHLSNFMFIQEKEKEVECLIANFSLQKHFLVSLTFGLINN